MCQYYNYFIDWHFPFRLTDGTTLEIADRLISASAALYLVDSPNLHRDYNRKLLFRHASLLHCVRIIAHDRSNKYNTNRKTRVFFPMWRMTCLFATGRVAWTWWSVKTIIQKLWQLNAWNHKPLKIGRCQHAEHEISLFAVLKEPWRMKWSLTTLQIKNEKD